MAATDITLAATGTGEVNVNVYNSTAISSQNGYGTLFIRGWLPADPG